MKGIGYISKEDAIAYGCTGPTGRGSGVHCDIRKLSAYEIYDQLPFEEILETGGDCYARYIVRMKEMRQSLSLVEQLIDNIPGGYFQSNTKAVLNLPKVEFFLRAETASCEFGVYIVS